MFSVGETLYRVVSVLALYNPPPHTQETDLHHITPPHHLLNFVQILMVWQCDDVTPPPTVTATYVCTCALCQDTRARVSVVSLMCLCRAAIRFGRMPQSEKQRLRAEQVIDRKEEHETEQPDAKSLARLIHEAYLKHFHMNKAKARVFLTGKAGTPVSDTDAEATN